MKNKTILLVEDDPDDELLTINSLRNNNISNNIIVARDGEEAIDYLLCRGKYSNSNPDITPVLILLDIRLPKIDGIEVLRNIRSNSSTSSIPVVILTSSSEEKDIVNCYKLHANSYIRKPVKFSEFTETVKQIGVYWLLTNINSPE